MTAPQIITKAMASASNSRPAYRIVADAVQNGDLTLMEVVKFEERNPRWLNGLSELVAFVLMGA